jgi:hypothetical protein
MMMSMQVTNRVDLMKRWDNGAGDLDRKGKLDFKFMRRDDEHIDVGELLTTARKTNPNATLIDAFHQFRDEARSVGIDEHAAMNLVLGTHEADTSKQLARVINKEVEEVKEQITMVASKAGSLFNDVSESIVKVAQIDRVVDDVKVSLAKVSESALSQLLRIF